MAILHLFIRAVPLNRKLYLGLCLGAYLIHCLHEDALSNYRSYFWLKILEHDYIFCLFFPAEVCSWKVPFIGRENLSIVQYRITMYIFSDKLFIGKSSVFLISFKDMYHVFRTSHQDRYIIIVLILSN